MQTFRRFEAGQGDVPPAVAWYLADLGEARGKQELFRRQSPQMLKVLREHAIIESAVSSNRIEGVTVDQARVQTVVFGKSELRDRNEEEVRGYRNALKRIHEEHAKDRVSISTIQELHRVARAGVGDAGEFKTRDADIIEKYGNGSVRVRFRPVSAAETPKFIDGLIEGWNRCFEERWVNPLIALGAFSLDLLLCSPLSRWKWPCIAAASPAPVLPSGLRSGSLLLHEHLPKSKPMWQVDFEDIDRHPPDWSASDERGTLPFEMLFPFVMARME